MRKFLYLSALMLMLCFMPLEAFALDLQIKGNSCILIDGSSGQILYEQNADSKWYPASVTKLMTLTLALESVQEGKFNLQDMVTTSEEAANMGGSQVYVFAGEQRTLEEMLIAIAVGSGNDAAYAVAEHIGGSYNNFIKMMNEKAAELGMANTHFVNPHGLYDAEHYTSAADLAKLSFYALENTNITAYTSIYEYQFRGEPKPLVLWNTNRLLKWFPGSIGVKTGFTQESGYNLAACAERNNMRLISVVMGVKERNGHFTESMKLLNYGFNNYEYVQIYESDSEICKVPIIKGELTELPLILPQAAGLLQKKGEQSDITARISVNEKIYAPINRGDQLGKMQLIKNEEIIAEYPLLAGDACPKASFSTVFRRILKEIAFVA